MILIDMTTEMLLPVVLRWTHILSAVVAVGGLVFMRFVMAPSVRESLTDEQHARLHEQVVGRWRKIVMACIGLLLISGTLNFLLYSVPKARGVAAYHGLFGVKFLAAMGVFFLASALIGTSPAFQRMRDNGRRWMTINVGLAVLVILISGLLRILTL